MSARIPMVVLAHLLLAAACGSCPVVPGGGPCSEPEPESEGIEDPYLVGTVLTFVPSGIASLVGGFSASGTIEVPRGWHIFGVVSGTATIGLATASAIRSRDKKPQFYLAAPVIAGLVGVPALTLGIIGLLSPVDAKPPPAGALNCSGDSCRLGIPTPHVIVDKQGSPSPGLQLIRGRF